MCHGQEGVWLAKRFFFDLTDGHSTIRDEDGVLAADFDEAITQARAVLDEMRADDEFLDGDEEWALVIRDAAGEVLMTLLVVPRDPEVALAS
jgi:hypothetical protein